MASESTELLVKCSDRMKKYLSTCNLSAEVQGFLDEGQIPVKVLREIWGKCRREGVYLHELMEGSEILLPKYVPPPRNPELEARVQKLKNQQLNKEYQRMTKNVTIGHSQERNFGDELKSVQKMLITIINCVLTVLGSFAFAYKSVEYSLGTPNVGIQLCAGLIVGTVVFFADLYFLMKHELVEEGTIDQSVYDKM